MSTRPFLAHPALRWLVVLLVFCMGLQVVAASAQRALGPAHVHRAVAAPARSAPVVALVNEPVSLAWRLRSHGAAPAQPAPRVEHVRHDLEHHVHHHDTPAHHSHDEDDSSVVLVAEDQRAAPADAWPTLLRTVVHDVDACPPATVPAAASSAAACGPGAAPGRFISHTFKPLERPPRA